MSAEACRKSRGRPLFAVEEVFVSALFRQRGGDGFNGFRPLPAPGYRNHTDGALLGVGGESTVCMGAGRQHECLSFVVPCDGHASFACELSRLRFSVALPLGINGAARHSKDGNLNPKRVGRPGGTATLEAERRVASRPVGGVRLARFFKPQEVSPTHHSKFAPFFQMRLRRALLMLFAASKSATSSAELQSVAWGGGEVRDSPSRKNFNTRTAQNSPQFFQVRPVRLTAAPLSLRRLCRRPLGFHLDFAHRKTSEIPF